MKTRSRKFRTTKKQFKKRPRCKLDFKIPHYKYNYGDPVSVTYIGNFLDEFDKK